MGLQKSETPTVRQTPGGAFAKPTQPAQLASSYTHKPGGRENMDKPRDTFNLWRAAMDVVAQRHAWGGKTFEPYEAGSIVGYRVSWGDLPICTLALAPCSTGATFGSYPPSMKERQMCPWFDAEAEALAYREEQAIVRAVHEEARRRLGNKPTKRGPTEKVRLRAECFKRLKDAHPDWGYDTIAQHAADELKDSITGNTVRNTYAAMGWKWERADRVR